MKYPIIGSKKDLFVGIFSSQTDARNYEKTLLARKFTDNAYESHRWLERQNGFLRIAMNGFIPRKSSLINFKEKNEIKSIIDFGGGSGWLFFVLKSQLEWSHMEKYYVVENDTMVKYFANNKSDRGIQYLVLNKLKKKDEKIDCLYINSVIQYLPNLIEIENVIKKFEPKHILIDELPICKSMEFFSLQRYYEGYLIIKFLNEDTFENMLSNYGYKIVSKKGTKVQISKNFKWTIEISNKSIKAPKTFNYVFKLEREG